MDVCKKALNRAAIVTDNGQLTTVFGRYLVDYVASKVEAGDVMEDGLGCTTVGR